MDRSLNREEVQVETTLELEEEEEHKPIESVNSASRIAEHSD